MRYLALIEIKSSCYQVDSHNTGKAQGSFVSQETGGETHLFLIDTENGCSIRHEEGVPFFIDRGADLRFF